MDLGLLNSFCIPVKKSGWLEYIIYFIYEWILYAEILFKIFYLVGGTTWNCYFCSSKLVKLHILKLLLKLLIVKLYIIKIINSKITYNKIICKQLHIIKSNIFICEIGLSFSFLCTYG